MVESTSSITKLMLTPSIIQPATIPSKKSETNEEDFFEFSWKGKTQIAYNANIPYMDLSILVYTPKANFFSRALDQYIPLYIVYVAILIIGVVAVILIGIWIARPFRQLSSLMDAVSKGNLDVKFKPQALGFEIA